MNKNKTLVIATHNSAKFAELNRLLANSGYNLVSLADLGITHDVDETGTTFKENAILKATAYAEITGHLVLADDSGLEIDALNGEPGVYSKRYAGEHATDEEKRQFVLRKMLHVPEHERTARFVSVVAIAEPDGQVRTFDGTMQGLITTEPREPHIPEFPYCSVFLIPEQGKTITELYAEGKACAKSHRAIAVKKALSALL